MRLQLSRLQVLGAVTVHCVISNQQVLPHPQKEPYMHSHCHVTLLIN